MILLADLFTQINGKIYSNPDQLVQAILEISVTINRMSKENDETLDFYKTKQLAYTLFILSERAFNEKAYKQNHE